MLSLGAAKNYFEVCTFQVNMTAQGILFACHSVPLAFIIIQPTQSNEVGWIDVEGYTCTNAGCVRQVYA